MDTVLNKYIYIYIKYIFIRLQKKIDKVSWILGPTIISPSLCSRQDKQTQNEKTKLQCATSCIADNTTYRERWNETRTIYIYTSYAV